MDDIQGACLIELHVENPHGLFEPFDASPLGRRHLDSEVEQFIMHRALETPAPSYALALQYSGGSGAPEDAAVSAAITNHFAHRSREESRVLAACTQEAKRDLVIGLLFLLLCAAMAFAASKLLSAPLGLFVEQGLLIIGWVALWRPIDLFLYELRPMRTRRRLFDALSRMDVRFYPGL